MNDEKLVEFMAGLDGLELSGAEWPKYQRISHGTVVSLDTDYLNSRNAAMRVVEKQSRNDREGFVTCLWQVMDCPHGRGKLVFATAKQICIALAKQFEVYDEEEPVSEARYRDHHDRDNA